jgi:hypothetical protein
MGTQKDIIFTYDDLDQPCVTGKSCNLEN